MRGKEVPFDEKIPIAMDHPRVCGEKKKHLLVIKVPQGSPPRMRGKVFPVSGALWSSRITPAYAGKSKSGHELIADTEDHPRVCGEKAGKETDAVHNEGSPPRMRGKDRQCSCPCGSTGITPAYAGKRKDEDGSPI